MGANRPPGLFGAHGVSVKMIVTLVYKRDRENAWANTVLVLENGNSLTGVTKEFVQNIQIFFIKKT